ncbi:hypothetical protein [Leptospira bandrabouensis]|uniref:hypothetical protein n=1 Tax=Leptospira bandrabouensis TaxID=2484903 RepID=UPI001EE85656|nr:hypothetical protein [Leptospira bandrabouensis]MCG6160791.1 hypothetical protein [Leptospira bandrabouensis]
MRAANGKGPPNSYQTKEKICSTITVRFNLAIANSMELSEMNSIVSLHFYSNRQN